MSYPQHFAQPVIESGFAAVGLHFEPPPPPPPLLKMDSTYLMGKSSIEAGVVGGAESNCRTGRPLLRGTHVLSAAAVSGHTHGGNVPDKVAKDVGSAAAERSAKSERSSAKGKGPGLGGGRILHDAEKTGLGDQKDTEFSGILKRASLTHCTGTNGHSQGSVKHLDRRNPGRFSEPSNSLGAAQEQNAPLTERGSLLSSHIPVPRNRKPSGHADKEVMAATVLTSLSTSPLVLYTSSASTVPEPHNRPWKEALSASYSSSTSGNWSWDASDQSVPSTPSPPLSNDSKNFLLSPQGDDVSEDVMESTHFMFDDPVPRKRKNSMKVMFKCLWKNCEKVLSTSSGIQRHVRTIHLGRNSDSDYSDGEEDFYYSEIEVNMDSLSEGLSSLTPTSPTTAGPPPVFPPPLADVPRSENIDVNGLESHAPTLLSHSAPSTLCHIRTDHAYQATAPVSPSVGRELAELGIGNETRPGTETGNSITVLWQSPPVVFKGAPGLVTPVRTVGIGEKRLPPDGTHTTVNKNQAVTAAATKSLPGTRKPRGEAKKCRKVYGMEKKDMWCTACRWKKACQRFTD